MDMNDFMSRMLRAQESQAKSLASLADNLATALVEMRSFSGQLAQTAGDVTTVDLATGKVESTNPSVTAAVEQKAEAMQEAKAEAMQETKAETVQEEKKKAPSADEVRAALKVYAQANGNPAAMKLLEQFGATSVSTLEEDKRQELIDAAK